jgi:hypothetical protein
MFKGLVRPELSEIPNVVPLLRCAQCIPWTIGILFRLCQRFHYGVLRRTLIKTNQTHLAFWKVVSNYFFILLLFLWCRKWVFKCVALRAWMPRDGLDVSCIEIGSL